VDCLILAGRVRLRSTIGTALVCVAGSLATPVFGGHPYSVIQDRNPFHLHPRAAVVAKTPVEPLPKVRLTGITTIFPGKRALFLVDYPPAKRSEKPKEESYILSEGQKAGPIQVLAIDEKKAQVKLDEAGIITNVTFEKIMPAPAPKPAQPVSPWNALTPRRVYR
jgi:hypothetical protein